MGRFVNIIYKVTVAVIMSAAVPASAMAQTYANTPVEMSKEKVKIDGKIFYSHIVLEKQTLYSISKAYGVSVDEIYRYNPTIRENGLKKNSILMIPSADASTSNAGQESKNTAENIVADDANDIVQHKPDRDKLHPKRVHIAKWYEDLDVIAEQYGVTVEAIMAANNLKGRKLAKRQKLVIPYPEDTSKVREEDTSAEADPGIGMEIPEAEDSTLAVTPKTKVNATVMLPLTNSDGLPNRNNMDFYCGILLAVYDLSKEGTDCVLNVHDMMDGNTQFSIEGINASDVVIGPVSAADLTKFFYIAPQAKAVVSPLDPRAERLVAGHPDMIQIPTPHLLQYHDLVNWMEEDFVEGDKVVLITEKGARQSGIISQMREALDSSTLAYNQFSYSILEGRDVTEPLTSLMTAEGTNRILIASESEAFLNDVVRNLNRLIFNNIDIVLYAPSKIRSFETIEVDNLHNTSLHVSLTYYIDYESEEVKDFLMRYRALFNTEPTQFAFQGYDIARYFLGKCAEYGDNWKNMLADSPEDMLQSTFRFCRQTAGGGYTNSGVRRIIYDKGYSVKKVSAAQK